MKKLYYLNSHAVANMGGIRGKYPPPPPYCLEVAFYTQKNDNHYTTKPADSIATVSVFFTDAVSARRSARPSWTRRKTSAIPQASLKRRKHPFPFFFSASSIRMAGGLAVWHGYTYIHYRGFGGFV
jgi:hypothetical protein